MRASSRLGLLVFLVLGLASPARAAAPPPVPPWDPTTTYSDQTLRGWTLHVHCSVLAKENEALWADTRQELDSQLYRITRAVPAAALAQLRRVPLWVELAHPKHPCMCYHPSAGWLRDNGMNPAKAGGVELANCKTFLAWTHAQPWMVLHELAHAYHHQVLGFDHPKVRACYHEALRARLYDSVLHVNGTRRRHYACTNAQEYFAEMSEAYFGRNDFYPFVRVELKQVDPRMHDLLEEVWGVKARR